MLTMDVHDPQWSLYEERFLALAAMADLTSGAKPAVGSTRLYLCLYGENGLTPCQEFATLQELAQVAAESPQKLRKIEVETSYWQEIILYVV
ncbi:MAG: hypothetical protein VKK59_05310 [Vampirovibrionales bacterium]|nr:hypothetical protein [Vampirovibrionales bacterium]